MTPEPGLGVPDTHLGAAYPNPIDPPSGCTFHPRCSQVMDHCSMKVPPTIEKRGGMVECHLYSSEKTKPKKARARAKRKN